MSRISVWFGGWRASLLLCVMSGVLAGLWAAQGRSDWLVPLCGAWGWGLCARMEWKQENQR